MGGQAREYELNRRERMVKWLWERMTAAHGERWAKVYGTVWDKHREKERKKRPHLWPRLAKTAALWARYLEEFDSEAIGRAVEQCTGREALPTLPQFLALCRGEQGDAVMRHEPVIPESEQARAARRRNGYRAISGLREMLGEDDRQANGRGYGSAVCIGEDDGASGTAGPGARVGRPGAGTNDDGCAGGVGDGRRRPW